MQNIQRSTRPLFTVAVTALAALTLAGCASGANGETEDADGNAGTAWATAELENAQGDAHGQVEFYDVDGGTEIVVEAKNLEQGF